MGTLRDDRPLVSSSARSRAGRTGLIAAVLNFCAAAGILTSPHSSWAQPPLDRPGPHVIKDENRKRGSDDWQLTRVRPDREEFRSPWVEGYCSKQSVSAGETIDIMVSTNPARRFEIEVFRMGYYGGRGARSMTKLGPFDGTPQPVPEPGPRDLHECRWKTSSRLTIPADWPSGVYLGRLTTLADEPEPYWQSYVVFIVRDDRPADILFQCSDNTWQAYNRWPSHYSIYTHPKGVQGPWADVSFDRPYGREAQFAGVVNDPLTFGSGEFLPLEFPPKHRLRQRLVAEPAQSPTRVDETEAEADFSRPGSTSREPVALFSVSSVPPIRSSATHANRPRARIM